MSPKWPILCRVGCKTTTQTVNLLCIQSSLCLHPSTGWHQRHDFRLSVTCMDIDCLAINFQPDLPSLILRILAVTRFQHISNCQCTVQNHNTLLHPFNGPLSRTTQVSRYQKGKTNLDFTGARDCEWQWHQLGHMQVCTLLQTDNHASTSPVSFLQARCPTNSVKALKAKSTEGKTTTHLDVNSHFLDESV